MLLGYTLLLLTPHFYFHIESPCRPQQVTTRNTLISADSVTGCRRLNFMDLDICFVFHRKRKFCKALPRVGRGPRGSTPSESLNLCLMPHALQHLASPGLPASQDQALSSWRGCMLPFILHSLRLDSSSKRHASYSLHSGGRHCSPD